MSKPRRKRKPPQLYKTFVDSEGVIWFVAPNTPRERFPPNNDRAGQIVFNWGCISLEDILDDTGTVITIKAGAEVYGDWCTFQEAFDSIIEAAGVTP